MKSNPITGAGYLIEGLGLIFRKGIRKFVLIPLLVNVTLFSLLIWYGAGQFNTFMEWLLRIPSDVSETVVDHDLVERELSRFGPRILRALADGDHRTHHVVLGQADQFRDLVDVEADHRARVVAHGLGGHQVLHTNSDGTVTLLATEVKKA